MNQVQSTLEHVKLGNPTTFRNLSIFPLQNPEAKPADYITLTEALKRETVEISEVSDHGQVPELLFDNHDDKPVLIVDGEELVGAKQNRVTNVTILAPAHARTIIPVSCVEAGRWDWSSRHFNVSERAHYSRGRAARHVNVAASMKATGTYGGNQGEVWDDISAKAARMSVHSRTEAMADMFEEHRPQIESYVSAFKPGSNAVGAMFAIDGQVEGVDLFDRADTLAQMLPKLVRSYAIDALESADAGSVPASPATRSGAEAFLKRVAAARAEHYSAIGLGTDVRLNDPGVVAGALIHDDNVIHLAGFATGTQGPGSRRHGPATERARRRAMGGRE